ncbi:MAG: permease [Halolamina sp.]
MNARSVALGLGTAVTTFLLVGAGTIELLGGGEAPGIGILGVFAGLVAGVLAGGLVGVGGDRLSRVPAAAMVGYAAFGVTFLVIAGMSYVNVPGADETFTFTVHLVVSGVVAVVAALVAWYSGRAVVS